MSALVSIILFLVGLFLLLFFATIFLRLGASIAGVPSNRNTIFRALCILILTWVVFALIGGVGSLLPVLGPMIGVLVALLINVLIIGGIFEVGFWKALITYVFSLIFQVAFVVIASLIFGGSLAFFMTK
jgi:hypothetical protein